TRISTRVCGCTPSTAETTSTAPSSTASARSTSAMKSECPGVSIRLTDTPSSAKLATAALMVMPRRRSSSRESVTVLPASTLPISPMTPVACNRRSVSEVLPASTWARIPRFSERKGLHVLDGRGRGHGAGHESRSHLNSSGRGAYSDASHYSRPRVERQQVFPGRYPPYAHACERVESSGGNSDERYHASDDLRRGVLGHARNARRLQQ